MVGWCKYLETLNGRTLPKKRVAMLRKKEKGAGKDKWQYVGGVNGTLRHGLPEFHGFGKMVFFTKKGVKNTIRGNWINGVLHGENIDIFFDLPSGKRIKAKANYIFGQRTSYTVES